MTNRRRATRRQGGQATVEFALTLPLVLVSLLSIVQVGVAVYTQLEVTHAASEAARRLVVDRSLDVAELETELGSQLQVTFVPSGGSTPGRQLVQVRSSAPVGLVTPLFGPILGDLELHGEAVMLLE